MPVAEEDRLRRLEFGVFFLLFRDFHLRIDG
jgi:hypothetical protein